MASSRKRPLPPVLGLAASLAFALAGAIPAAAQTPPDGSSTSSDASSTPTPAPLTADQLPTAVALAADDAKVSSQLGQVTDDLTRANNRNTTAHAAYAQVEDQYRRVATSLADALYALHRRAVVAYEQHASLVGADLEIQDVQSVAAGDHYVSTAATAGVTEVSHLTDQVVTLKADVDRSARAVRDAESQVLLLNTEHGTLSAQSASDERVLGSLGGVPVLGTARLTAQQLAAWFQSTGQRAQLSGTTTIEQLAQLYSEEGTAANVRGDIAFAQAIVETGSFGHATDNNYAGIGACDSCRGEPGFPTPRAGVRAQVQLLRCYADPDSTAANLGNPPDPTLFGADPAAAAASFNGFSLKGKVPLWNQMGHGNWATDPNYAGKVLRLYAEMLDFSAHPG